jgi:lipoprotein-releasing system permease protein
MLMSFSGIVFGVGFFIVTQAQTSGFQQFFIQTILGVDGMIRVEDRFQSTMRSMEAERGSNFEISLESNVRYIPGVQFPERILSAIQHFPGVIAAAPVIRGSGIINANFRSHSCRPYGIDAEKHFQVSDLEEQIIRGSAEAFKANPYAVLIGERLAKRLNIMLGDSVLIESHNQNIRYRVAGIFETGIGQVDKERIFLHLAAARILLDRPNGASFLQVNLSDPSKAPEVAERMQASLSHAVTSWQWRERTWLQVFNVLRISSALTVSSIILIAGLGMFNTLAMIVIDKTREIAILRSIGFTRADIVKIFMYQGLMVLSAGIVGGAAFAAALTYGLSRLPIRIRGIFASDSFIVNWDISHYIWAAAIATLIVGVASYFPARKAARLEPGVVIRNSGS